MRLSFFAVAHVGMFIEWFPRNCPDFKEDQLLDTTMALISLIPLCMLIGTTIAGVFDRYVYFWFVCNGSFANALLHVLIEFMLPLDEWSDYPNCSYSKSSHVDGNVSNSVYISVFCLTVAYKHSLCEEGAGQYSTFAWARYALGALMLVSSSIAADLYLQLYNVYDIMWGIGLGAFVGVIFASVLVDVIRPNLESRFVKTFFGLMHKKTNKVARFWENVPQVADHNHFLGQHRPVVSHNHTYQPLSQIQNIP